MDSNTSSLRTMSLDPSSTEFQKRSPDVAPVPLFKMRNRPSSGINFRCPRPYSYDVGALASSNSAENQQNGELRSPRSSNFLARIYERRPQGAVGRQALSARNNYMNVQQSGTGDCQEKSVNELGFKKLTTRSTSQTELLPNGAPTGGWKGAKSAAARGSPDNREFGSTSSIEALGLPAPQITSTPIPPATTKSAGKRTPQPVQGRSKSSQLSGSTRAGVIPSVGVGGGSVFPNNNKSESGGGALSARNSAGESILRRLKLTASKSSGGGSSSTASSSNNNPSSQHEDRLAEKKNAYGSSFGYSFGSEKMNNPAQDLASAVLSNEDYSSSAEAECFAGLAYRKSPVSKVVAYHDCASLAAAWELGVPRGAMEPGRPTGASQAQSPGEDDPGDGKDNFLVQSCQAFRNELGKEPVRRLALNRHVLNSPSAVNQCVALGGPQFETWHREATAAEAGVLENLSNVYLGGRLCAARQPQLIIEPPDSGAFYYRHCFAGRAHHNYFGMDDHLGPVAISLVRERIDDKEAKFGGLNSNGLYRLIIRLSDLRTFRVSIPEDALPDSLVGDGRGGTKTPLREVLELVLPQLTLGSLRLGLPVPRTEELLLKLDEQPVYTRYKVGILYCRAGQSTEEQMYNNENAGPAFEEFLEFLGQKVRLKGFDGYKGGLDTRGDTTGTHSYYSVFQQHQIMFHVSTCLPYTPSNRQQLSRKRHIGNDMVTVVFQECGALPFSPLTVRSHFQHVFIVVRVSKPCSDALTYETTPFPMLGRVRMYALPRVLKNRRKKIAP